jgi:hypothetical protein
VTDHVQNFMEHELTEQEDIKHDPLDFQNCQVEFAEKFRLRQHHRKIPFPHTIASLRGNMRVRFNDSPATNTHARSETRVASSI